MSILLQQLQDVDDAKNECVEKGKIIEEMLKDNIPEILKGNTALEGSELEYLLEAMKSPEKRESMGWAIVESTFTPTLSKLFIGAKDTEIGESIISLVKNRFEYDLITMSWI